MMRSQPFSPRVRGARSGVRFQESEMRLVLRAVSACFDKPAVQMAGERRSIRIVSRHCPVSGP